MAKTFLENHTKINTECGEVYIEKFDCREEDDRVKLYDSDGIYLNYLPTGGLTEGEYTKWLDIYKIMKPNMIRAYFSDRIEYIGTKDELTSYLVNELLWDKETIQKEFTIGTRNDMFNRIGDTWVMWED